MAGAPDLGPGGPGRPQTASPTRPRSLATAVLLMYLGAGLSLLALVVTFVLRSAIRHQVQDASSSGTSGSDVDTAVSVALAVVAVSAVISAVLWLLMARANGAGRKWARVVATILFGLNVLFTAVGLSQPRPFGSIVVSLVILAVGGYIVFLLFRPDSSRYYDARSAPVGSPTAY